MNDTSSRSHAILTLHLDKSKIHICDLAGSECIKKSGTTGKMFVEATYINSDLLFLGNVVQSLVENDGKPRGYIN